ncbi:RING-H2 finger protein ATL73-like [Dioscorea cayenensis subsp. rotundata]|uniref:RING-H2 finger protein ATL73-like n=1 Tax=Dioscorea cayennensis subsp. rotundata TaxID=55577 RepID=A0AB40C8D8_DIOCR|nr:RING-H2 finger protein ATL73-like [Dioscorea cayenensis subsp. rotundata]
MASAEPPAASPSLIYMPLVIALCIIASVVLALLALHSMIVRLCSGDRRETSQAAIAGGVEKKVVDAIPVHAYTKKEKSLWLSQNDCPVCLGELEEGEPIKVLPDCHHIFHVLCIDTWLAFHSTCPFCRCEITMSDSLVVPEGDGVSGGGGDASSACPSTSGSILMHFMEMLKLRSSLELQQNIQQHPSDGSSRRACVMV